MFKDNLDVFFYGAVMNCSGATLTAYKLIAMYGLTVSCNTNRLEVNVTNTAITRPLAVNGAIAA